MDDSIPLTPELPERKNRLSSNSGIKRNKVSRACDECRKRKVRCDGAQPCARCQKSSTECIFSNVTPKRGPPKKYLEPFETRLKTIDQVLKHLEILTDNVEIEKGNDSWDVKDPSAIETNTHLNVTAIGRAMYMPDLPAKKDRIEPLHNADVNFEPPQPSIMDNAASVTLRFDLIQCYFDRIHPSMPFIAKSTLTGSKPSALLLNAIYAVSSKFAPSTTSTAQRSMDPPGWSYYKAAMSLMDTYLDVPRLSTIQALLLLVKYHEHIHRPGFFWRTKFLLQLAVAMATDLGLSGNMVKEIEQCKRGTEMTRRTFWAVYTYQVLMSTEQGSALQPASKECTVDYPHVLSDESGPDASIASAFHWLAKVIHIQAAVIEFMRSKYSIDNSTSSHNDETHEFDLIEHTLSNLGARIPSMSEGGGRLVSFVHIIYHLTVILLHRPYALEDKRATFVNRCLASASTITQIVEQLLNTEGAESLATVFRGHQQIVYCLTAAITVQRALKSTDPAVNDMYDKTHSLLQCMASKSPVTELETSAADNFFQTEKTDQHTKSPSNASSARSSPLIPSLNSPHSPSIPAPTIRKRHSRSSLQFPASDMSYVMQSSASFVPEVVGHRMRPAGRSPYASNRLSAPLLGSLYQQSPYFYQQQLQQQQMHHQMQLQQQQQQQQQQRLSSYSQPSSPTTSQFSGNNDYNAPPASVTPRRTTSLSRKTGLRRSASSTGEFVVPSQRPPRTSSRPYINPRRHTLTNTTPPDLSNVIAVVPPHSNTPMLDTNTNVTSTPRTLHAMAVRNNRFSAPVMSNNTQHPYMIPITSQQQQQYQFQQQQQQQQQQQRQHQMQYQYQQQNQQQMQQQQQQQMQQQMQQQHQIHHQQQHQQQQEEPYHQPMMIDHASFPMDPVIPDSPNESMMGLLMNPWDFPREP